MPEAYARRSAQARPLPGAKELLEYLTASKVHWGVATSGRMASAHTSLRSIGVDPTHVPVITRDQVEHTKPDPDLLITASDRLHVDAVVVGDSVWDLLAARRARSLVVGLLWGGYGREELERAGGVSRHEDPGDLLRHLNEVGVRQQTQSRHSQ